jgi:death-on-curing protein
LPKRRSEPTWLDRIVVDAVQLDQIREHGGLPGLRDENALESAVARPVNRWHYALSTDAVDLAAAYGWGLTTSHPYRDGNKRIGFLVMAIFLALNGFELEASDEEVVQLMLSVADHGMSETELATWVRSHVAAAR